MAQDAAGDALEKDTVPYDVPPLHFDAGALEPAISRDALAAHHGLVHRGYADAINRILAPHPDLAARTIEEVLQAPDDIPPELRDAVLDIGSAHANHQFLWKIVGPSGGAAPRGTLADAISQDFGGIDGLHSSFQEAAMGLDRQGWAFLTLAKPGGARLEVHALPSNASVLPLGKPGVLVCDLWGHAWERDHPDRGAWLDAFWSIVDWSVCEDRYEAFQEGRVPA